jgi:hypothetical protein
MAGRAGRSAFARLFPQAEFRPAACGGACAMLRTAATLCGRRTAQGYMCPAAPFGGPPRPEVLAALTGEPRWADVDPARVVAAGQESGGTVLDHSTILFGSNMSNSDRHNNDPLPVAILGHAHGRIKGGQHVKYPQDSRFSDLLVTLFDRNNIPVEKLGDSAGMFSEI